MGVIKQSSQTEDDLKELRKRSKKDFGLARTLRYAQDLQNELRRLSDGYPHGVAPTEIAADLFRYRFESHYIYFRRIAGGIFVSRVLHTKQLAALHTFPRSDNE